MPATSGALSSSRAANGRMPANAATEPTMKASQLQNGDAAEGGDDGGEHGANGEGEQEERPGHQHLADAESAATASQIRAHPDWILLVPLIEHG